jgi:hypothetical protein
MAAELRAADGPGNVVFLARPERSRMAAHAPARQPEQLAIEFERPRQLHVVATDRLHGATFLRSLIQVKPVVLLDFRFAPHFKFTAVDGVVVRSQIEAMGIRYAHHSVPFHEFGPSLLKHDPLRIATVLPELARANGSLGGPFMVMMKEVGIAHDMSRFLIGALVNELGGRWSLEITS